MALTSKHLQALDLLLGPERLTQEQIAERLGITPTTLTNWLHGRNHVEFKAEYDRRLADAANRARRMLQEHALRATSRVVECMDGRYSYTEAAVARVRLDAAKTLLARIGVAEVTKLDVTKLSDEELEAEIERRVAERGISAPEGEGGDSPAEGG